MKDEFRNRSTRRRLVIAALAIVSSFFILHSSLAAGFTSLIGAGAGSVATTSASR